MNKSFKDKIEILVSHTEILRINHQQTCTLNNVKIKSYLLGTGEIAQQ